MMSKTGDSWWFDLFNTRVSRRDALRIAGDVSALVALGALTSCAPRRLPPLRSNPFVFGVASGDPLPDGVVLWTRLAASALAEIGIAEPVAVQWEVADDDSFRRIVRRGAATALPELGFSVHAEVGGLAPGRVYWYRFSAGGVQSAAGLTRTAPAAHATPAALRFAFVSCQNYEHGYYTAYRHLSAEDVELIVHLGDYIYERTFPSSPRIREHEAGEVFTLDQYRARYALYRLDPHLQAAHAAAPWIVTADDHEVANDYANDQPETGDASTFLLRRAAAYQAYYEFMPLRRTAVPRGPGMQLYRRLGWGSLARFHVVDTRQYRSDQACGGNQSIRCPGAYDQAATMFGAEQERWLFDGLRASSARWNVLANQVIIMQLARNSAQGPTFDMDHWSGYVAPRQRLLEFMATARPSNPVVITGDIHSNWAADLKVDFDLPASPTVATEFVGTSISSGGDGRDTNPGVAATLAANPHIKFFNGQRGYVRCTLTPAVWTADYRVVPYVSRPDAPISTRATFTVENGRPGVQQ